MPKKETGNTLHVAQKLVGYLPKEMDDTLKILISHAQGGQDPSAEAKIRDLLSSNENIRRWMKEQINLQSGIRGYDPIPGESSAPVSERWTCPQDDEETLPVIQEGEPAPQCEQHKVAMVRKKKSGG